MTNSKIWNNAVENAVRYGHTAGIRMCHRLGFLPKGFNKAKWIPFCVDYVLHDPDDYSSECVRIARKRKEGKWYDAAD